MTGVQTCALPILDCMGNPKKCLSMWVGGKIIPNLNGKDDEG